MSDLQTNNRIEELSDEELSHVLGGINPQPLPP
jgi:bacteriocin-like protein